MPWIIESKANPSIFYCGDRWDSSDKAAKQYASKSEADAVIGTYRMQADAVEINGNNDNEPTPAENGDGLDDNPTVS